jgi:hypothetical protein
MCIWELNNSLSCTETHAPKLLKVFLRQGWRNYSMWHSLLSHLFSFFCPTSFCTLWRICLFVLVSDLSRNCIWITVVTKQLRVKHFTQIRTAKCWLDIYHWGDGLVVTGCARDTGHKVLQYYFQTEGSSSPSYCHTFFLIAFLEIFIRNKIILLYINYTVIFFTMAQQLQWAKAS